MKLYLTSFNVAGILNLIDQEPSQLKLAFIPTAADPYQDKWFVAKDREDFTRLGFNLFDVDLKNQTLSSLEAALSPADIIYLSGGNCFYLLHHIYQSGLDQIIKGYISQKKIIAGGSAGAAVMGLDISPLAAMDDPSQAPELKTTKGLGLVNFMLAPHYGKEKYKEKYDQIFQETEKRDQQLLTLTDSQALLVIDHHHQIISV